MQGNQKNQRLIAATSGVLTSWLLLSASVARAQEIAPLEISPVAPPAENVQTVEPIAPNAADLDTNNLDTAVRSQDTEATLNQATTLLTVMLAALGVLLGVGIAMLWALRKSVVNEVATIVRTQLNEMTELENKVHNATRSLNRVLADADDLSGELQGRSNNFQREVTAQREILYKLIEELNEFKLTTARNWEKQLEGLNERLEATAADFAQAAAE